MVLLVGRLVYEKGFQLALDALPGVIEKVAGVRFLVAGSGTHEGELRAQAERLGLSERGVFLGWIGDDALHSLYRIADLCVVPSLYEPFGLVALEAMASGCPCIVADTGGLREVVPAGERVGLRFNGGDPEHLGVMIERLLVDVELRDRLVTEASEHVLSFDWSDVAQRTRAIYSDVAATTQRSHSKTGVGADARRVDAGRFPAHACTIRCTACAACTRRRRSSRSPTRGTVRATYGQVCERVDRLARVLEHLGVGQGDCVGTFAWNNQRHFELYMAVPCVGAVLHTLNIRLFAEQLTYIVNHAQDGIDLCRRLARAAA